MANAVSAVLEHPSAAEPPPTPHAQAQQNHSQNDSTARYRPARFEHHVDNLATIDQVLGTVCYVLAIAGLFGLMRGVGFRIGGMESIILFVMGWYLRETGENLRKYRLSARTSQAVVAIIAGFTVILLPYTIYSFWVLFGHRGRTYFDARNRGLGENEAARHTYRVIESDFTPPPMPPPAPGAPASPAPRPEQIPVQSMLTSHLESAAEQLPSSNKRKKISRWIKLGFVGALVTAVVAIVMAVFDPVYANNNDVIAAMLWATLALLAVGLLKSLLSRQWRAVLWGLVGVGLVVVAAAIYVETVQKQVYREYQKLNRGVLVRGAQSRQFIAQYLDFGSRDPKIAHLSPEQTEWIREQTGIKGDLPLRVVNLGNHIQIDLPWTVARNDYAKRALIVYATQEAIVRAHPTEVIRYGGTGTGVDAYLRAKLAGIEAPGDRDRATLWIGTLKRGVDSKGTMPPREKWTLSTEQTEWLKSVTGFRDAGLLEFEIENGLVHATLPNFAFSRDRHGAWLLILAAQQMVALTRTERSPEMRKIPAQAVGLPFNVANALSGQIKRTPPPGAAANR